MMIPPPTRIPHSSDSRKSQLEWWQSVLRWLYHLRDAIEVSLCKDLEDLTALDRSLTNANGTVVDIEMRQIAEMPSIPCPTQEEASRIMDSNVPRAIKEQMKSDFIQRHHPWLEWAKQEHALQTCSLEPCFYGVGSLGQIEQIPTTTNVAEISRFVESHERYLFKHWDHLEYLSWDLISHKLIPQVEERIKVLEKELEHMEQIANLEMFDEIFDSYMHRRFDLEGFASKGEQTVYSMYPETEDEYPDHPEEGEETDVERVSEHFGDLCGTAFKNAASETEVIEKQKLLLKDEGHSGEWMGEMDEGPGTELNLGVQFLGDEHTKEAPIIGSSESDETKGQQRIGGAEEQR